MAQSRINLLRNKTVNSVKIQKRQTAALLREGKDESARIKAENIVREDYLLDALDILQLFCDLLLTRINLIAESKECPHDMKEAVSTLIYAAPRVDVEELMEIRTLLQAKFGKAFVEGAMENREMIVNQRVVLKLDLKVPKPHLCISYIKQIAEEHGIEWEDIDEDEVIEQDKVNNPELGYPSRNEATGYNVNFNPNVIGPPVDQVSPEVLSKPNVYSPQNHVDFVAPQYQPSPPTPQKSASQKMQELNLFAPDPTFDHQFGTTPSEQNIPPIAPNSYTTSFNYEYDEPAGEEDDLQRRLRELSRPKNVTPPGNESDDEPNNDSGSNDDQHDYDELKKRFERLNRK